MTEFTRGDIVKLKPGQSYGMLEKCVNAYYLGTHVEDLNICQLQIPGFASGDDGTTVRKFPIHLKPMPGIKSSGTDMYNVPIDILELVTKVDQKTSEFQVGDKVKISWNGNESDGKIGTIVRKHDDVRWTIKIPGFDGHYGGIEDGTKDKWCISESNLTKLPVETVKEEIKVSEPCQEKEIQMNKFKIDDKVKISWTGDNSHGKIGTIVRKHDDVRWTIKIPGFFGHSGGIEDGTKDKWCIHEKFLIKISDSTKIEFKNPSQKIEEKIPTTGVTQTKEKEKKMFNINFSELLTKNKELAIQEAQRQVGKIVFEHLYDLPVIQNLPESIKGFLKTAVGKFVVANLVKTISTFYTGPNQDKIEFITDSLLRGALSDLGDSFNINKIFSDLTSKVAHLIPGESKE
jgi:hypothetical protein